MILSLLLTLSSPESRLLLTCEQFDWLVERTFKSELLSPSEKIEFVGRYADWTDPTCFRDKT